MKGRHGMEGRKGRRRGREEEGNLAPTVISKSRRLCSEVCVPTSYYP